MNVRPCLIVLACCFVVSAKQFGFAQTIQFDLPPIAASRIADSSATEMRTAQVPLRLSAMVEPGGPSLDHLMIRVVPRDSAWSVENYLPKTETATVYAAPIQTEHTEESSQSAGLSGDVAYGHLIQGHAGFDQGNQTSAKTIVQTHGPLQTVTAAGTIERGRGVFFKMNWTSQQILEGEKTFSITFDIPKGCRGGLLDVIVMAHRASTQSDASWIDFPTLGSSVESSMPSKTELVAMQSFVVAVHGADDAEAKRAAHRMINAETRLRAIADREATHQTNSFPNLFRHIAAKLDMDGATDGDWVNHLVAGSADPYVDPRITKLSTAVRVAALDYAESRRRLVRLRDHAHVSTSPRSWP